MICCEYKCTFAFNFLKTTSMKKIIHFSLPLLAILLLNACQTPEYDASIQSVNLIIRAEGPLFEGENTAQGLLDLDALPGTENLPAYKKAALTEFRLQKTDGSTFDGITQMTLLLVNDNSDMQKVAVINPVDERATELVFQTAGEQKGIAELLNSRKITFVIDFTLEQDSDEDLVFTATYRFDGKKK